MRAFPNRPWLLAAAFVLASCQSTGSGSAGPDASVSPAGDTPLDADAASDSDSGISRTDTGSPPRDDALPPPADSDDVLPRPADSDDAPEPDADDVPEPEVVEPEPDDVLPDADDVLPEPDDVSPDAAPDGDAPDSEVDAGPEPATCDFYADPLADGTEGVGSAANPWGPLDALAAQGKLPDGGLLCLLDGYHGTPQISGHNPTTQLTIRAAHPHLAVVGSLTLQGCSNLVFEGLKVDGAQVIDPTADERHLFLVNADVGSSSFALVNLVIQSADSSSSWTWDDWRLLARSGVDLRGPSATVSGCQIRNVHHALSLRGDHALADANLIDNFGGDGIRGLGSHSTYQWNTVRDAYIDEYEVQHDDAFQAYELDGDLRIENVTIRHNRFLLFADPVTDFVLQEELVGTLMQGVIITDGYADGWVVENNLVVNSQAHGISLFGARNCRIQNNTVVRHPAFDTAAGPWIRIADQTKTGQTNFDNVIRNNLTTMLTPWDYDATSTVENNLEVDEPDAHFQDAAALDFHLLASSAAVNAGVDMDSADVDLDALPRAVGASVDLGAFENQAPGD